MSTQVKKQFGVWMDGQQATVAGRTADNTFTVLGHVKHSETGNNSNENAANHRTMALAQKYFKEIAALMPNVDEIHVTGTGQVQEQFIHFLAGTPQYKEAKATESTSLHMEDAQLLAFLGKHFG